MATSFSQSSVNAAFGTFLDAQEGKLKTQVDTFSTRTEPPSQAEMLSFQLAMQAYTFMGQFASSVQKELHDAVKAVVSRL